MNLIYGKIKNNNLSSLQNIAMAIKLELLRKNLLQFFFNDYLSYTTSIINHSETIVPSILTILAVSTGSLL